MLVRKMLRFPMWLVLLGLAWLSLFMLAFQPDSFGTLEELLVWVVAGGGAMVLAGYFVAYFLENLAFWHTLPVWIKTVVPLVIAGVLGVVGSSLLSLDLLKIIPPGIQALILMLVNWVFSQRAYMGTKRYEGQPYAYGKKG
jgi:fructose-specific phosphotransferase system IIC component